MQINLDGRFGAVADYEFTEKIFKNLVCGCLCVALCDGCPLSNVDAVNWTHSVTNVFVNQSCRLPSMEKIETFSKV